MCYRHECNMGNLVTDAMVHQNAKSPNDLFWSHVAVAIMNAGAIRDNFEKNSK